MVGTDFSPTFFSTVLSVITTVCMPHWLGCTYELTSLPCLSVGKPRILNNYCTLTQNQWRKKNYDEEGKEMEKERNGKKV